jgi:hypothetical protein
MIDCLYVNGCSWTYGSDLELEHDNAYRIHNNWASHLGRKLGLEVFNGSAPGAGNDRILRTTTRDVLDLVEQGRHPLILVAWSSLQRFELPEGEHVGRWRPFVAPGMGNPNVVETIFNKWSNDHSDLVRWLQSIILLDCLAKTHSLPFFSTCIFWTNWSLLLQHAEHPEITTYFKALENQVGIDNHKLGTSLMKLIKGSGLPLTKYHHPLEDGHVFISDYLQAEIEQRFKFKTTQA